MRYARVNLVSLGYELAPNVVTSEALEQRLAPIYEKLKLPRGQIELLTGIRERRYWDAGQSMWEPAAKAARKALRAANVAADDVGMVIYAGVCRDNLEPATACAVADALGVSPAAQVYDVSNACLGVLNGMIQAAGAIELGHVRHALIVSCESARQIVDLTIARLLENPNMAALRPSMATMTGGSGAIAVLLGPPEAGGHRLGGATIRTAPEHHHLCRWGPDTGIPSSAPMVMETDAAAVLENGVALGARTWAAFQAEIGWDAAPDRIICHQVGAWHRDAVLKALKYPPEQDFSTFEFLGNIGTVSLPITAAIAAERGFLEPGHRVAFCGIGSGLNCLILGVEW
ncbi:MAG TPA: 3-oxoacyl-ACP synthase III [Phycisphaerae bacterium]|nr:3-oxoacyl-ACP synthase III [Phycisphaerales bacterium]HRX84508.1 3-oxoacyl-ACP synthase III [Phycisphaerae bacterium]